jgi:polypeptide N-acetylgalactosaminyltransferase
VVSKLAGRRCLQKPLRRPGAHSTQPSGPASFEACLQAWSPGQLFTLTKEGFLMGDESVCLDCPQWEEQEPGVRFAACSGLERQRWEVDGAAGRVVHVASGHCLTVPTAATSDSLTLQRCTGDPHQQWTLEDQPWAAS